MLTACGGGCDGGGLRLAQMTCIGEP